ncbi:hypothetical protein D8804_00215 [Streptococcus oralis]|uniref:DUF1642 domain-containing protein n=1 Tax=Streptococcus oralis TaxID=1303 RepID=A0A3R9TQF7_STROR|nr:DUF1642 domain-containing protein [Streptococcus oralis]RSK10886.1 hypothetical protein D8804_00215 [Streptococcus oralis]
MKKQELIKKYKEYENGLFDIGAKAACQLFLKDLEQLDEPEKVKIPQFVAVWIEVCKENLTTSLYTAMNPNFMKENNQSFDLILWIKKTSNQETFARAWLDGYTVEEEKKYKITLLNRNDGDLYLVNQNADLADKYGHFSPVVLLFTKCTNFSKKCYELTKKDVVSYDFGWVFDCPGIKIEEVKDE